MKIQLQIKADLLQLRQCELSAMGKNYNEPNSRLSAAHQGAMNSAAFEVQIVSVSKIKAFGSSDF